ncbi:uncharacterized protein Dwil_GK26790 [Drosophila willistoni]|uniref:Uncharacterized protein n=1 Tax=Drosophila willistoni TaxID=7260 RepID=A0A0Q9X4K3_DROWI|nr:uncharacterized protein LOC124459793 isoform X2 [Drosophila willistoni]KRF99766.1 uncharacterized protein Dwil_GK26790 [Drosophila willistoni]
MDGSFIGFAIVQSVEIDDFEVPIEITTSRQKAKPQKSTVGRTRRTIRINEFKGNESGEMVDNYCCFWIYQKHPALPEAWEHREEYPFDFLFQGKFVKNKRNASDNQTYWSDEKSEK